MLSKPPFGGLMTDEEFTRREAREHPTLTNTAVYCDGPLGQLDDGQLTGLQACMVRGDMPQDAYPASVLAAAALRVATAGTQEAALGDHNQVGFFQDTQEEPMDSLTSGVAFSDPEWSGADQSLVYGDASQQPGTPQLDPLNFAE